MRGREEGDFALRIQGRRNVNVTKQNAEGGEGGRREGGGDGKGVPRPAR